MQSVYWLLTERARREQRWIQTVYRITLMTGDLHGSLTIVSGITDETEA